MHIQVVAFIVIPAVKSCNGSSTDSTKLPWVTQSYVAAYIINGLVCRKLEDIASIEWADEKLFSYSK